MTRGTRPARGLVGLFALALLGGLIALPVLAADPSSSPSAGASAAGSEAAPAASASPGGTDTPKPAKSPKPERASKPAKAPEVDVTLKGTVGTRKTADGETEYVLTNGTTVTVLDAGPPWFFGDAYPLKPYVGKQVTIVGTQRTGEVEVEVVSVDGKVLREPGKPPWAGGWKVVGKDHPGWSQEKWDRWQAKQAAKAKQHGTTCWPPGQCKDKADQAEPAESDEPEND